MNFSGAEELEQIVKHWEVPKNYYDYNGYRRSSDTELNMKQIDSQD